MSPFRELLTCHANSAFLGPLHWAAATLKGLVRFNKNDVEPLHTITYKSRLTQKKLYKKNDAIFSIYGKNGIIP